MTVRYLAGPTEDATYNFVAGAGATVSLPPDVRATSFTLAGPGLTAAETRVTRPENAFELRLPQARSAGNYTLSTADRSWSTGFSVNAPPAELMPALNGETIAPSVTERLEIVLAIGNQSGSDVGLDLGANGEHLELRPLHRGADVGAIGGRAGALLETLQKAKKVADFSAVLAS